VRDQFAVCRNCDVDGQVPLRNVGDQVPGSVRQVPDAHAVPGSDGDALPRGVADHAGDVCGRVEGNRCRLFPRSTMRGKRADVAWKVGPGDQEAVV
jgi:hypothetical protein